MEFQTAYYKSEHPTIDTGKGLTEQAHQDSCDINRILDDYKRTGLLKHAKQFEGKYDDVSETDFQTAMQTVANVKSMFEQLPGETRKRFSNSPGNFLNFVQNPNNYQELARMGILKGNDGLDINGLFTNSPRNAPSTAAGDSSGDSGQTSDSASEGGKTA